MSFRDFAIWDDLEGNFYCLKSLAAGPQKSQNSKVIAFSCGRKIQWAIKSVHNQCWEVSDKSARTR